MKEMSGCAGGDGNMKTLTVYGHSDDCLEAHGIKGEDEFSCFGGGAYKGSLLITSDKGSMLVHVIYDGCWSFAPGLAGEDISLPDWPMKFEWEGYTVKLKIEVPDNARLRYQKPEEE